MWSPTLCAWQKTDEKEERKTDVAPRLQPLGCDFRWCLPPSLVIA